MNTKKNIRKKLSNRELAEAYIFPHGLTKAEKEKEDAAFHAFRRKQLAEQTEEQKLLSRLLQLKYQLENYVLGNTYDPEKSFAWFLKEYIKTIDRRKKDFAHEIHVHETKLSQIITEKVEPNEKFLIRLELHSNGIIPAIYWYRLVERKTEHELMSDLKIRREEKKFVRNRLKVG